LPNGKLHKHPPKRLSNYKKAVKLEEGLTVARLKGELRFKKTQKGLEKSFREHIGRLIDGLPLLETAAVLAATVLIKNCIDGDPNLTERTDVVSIRGMKVFLPIMQTPSLKGIFGEVTERMAGGIDPEIFRWVLSFVLAFIIVKYGGQLIGLLGDTFKLAQFVMMFL